MGQTDEQPERDPLAEARDAAHKWKARADTAKRQVLSPALIRPLLKERIRTFRDRHRPVPDAEEQLLRVCPAYRDALVQPPSELVTRAAIDGLQWYAPPPLDVSLPFRGILQTRELAIGGVMLDLGANIGTTSIPRVILGDVTMAYCCEPDPLTYACLVRNVADNGLRGVVLPDQTAIGDRDGEVHLRRVGGCGGFHVVPQAAQDTIAVPCITLDRWIDRLTIDPAAVTFIKVDVEGFEQRVFAGAPRTLAQRHIAWQVEVKPAYLRAVGDSLASLCDMAGRAFTHFIDLNAEAAGSRVRPIGELADGLAYVDQMGKTDLLLFNSTG